MRTFNGLDFQNTPGKKLHQIDAHIIFDKGEYPLDLAAYNRWHKQEMA